MGNTCYKEFAETFAFPVAHLFLARGPPMGRVLVTNLGKCCKSQLDLSAGGSTSASENSQRKTLFLLFCALGRSIFVVWKIVRIFILKDYPAKSLVVLGNDFKLSFLVCS